MKSRIDKISGAAVPRMSRLPAQDLAQLYRYLFEAMEQLRFVIEELGRNGAGGEALNKLETEIEQRLEGAGFPNNLRAGRILSGRVTGTSSPAKTATVAGMTSQEDGTAAFIVNDAFTSASGFTLDVNGFGAKKVYNSQSGSAVTTAYAANAAYLFVYNSARDSGNGGWDMYVGYDSNTNTIGYQLRTNSTTMPVTVKTYRYRILFTSADGTKLVPATASSSTNATAARTVNQTPINPFGRILYYSATAAVDANAMPGAGSLWSQYVLTLGYSFNRTGAALTLTPNKPVYLKCAPQTDGSAIIDDTTPYVQALPSSDDGKIYISLGTAVNETQVEMVPEHPVYQYKNSKVQLYTGA